MADLVEPNYGPTAESSEVELFTEEDIPWDEIAFPTVYKTLKYFLEDRKKGNFPFREEAIKLYEDGEYRETQDNGDRYDYKFYSIEEDE